MEFWANLFTLLTKTNSPIVTVRQNRDKCIYYCLYRSAGLKGVHRKISNRNPKISDEKLQR